MIKPFIHWCGGKRQLLPEIKKLIPQHYYVYREPFVGAGALFLDLQPDVAVVNDLNSELINCYKVIRDNPEQLIEYLHFFADNDSESYYYDIRNLDRNSEWSEFSDDFKAARTIYLNKTCFNGLYRVNSKGQFNSPWGKHKRPFVVEEALLRELHEYFKWNDVSFQSLDFEDSLRHARTRDLIYFDPPYDPVSETASFTSYTKDGFGKAEQIRLRDCFINMTERGCFCILSNSDTSFIRDLYKCFRIIEVQALRCVNSDATKRGKVGELLIVNF